METLEEFFKNRVSFVPHSYFPLFVNHPIPYSVHYTSINIFEPEEYSLDFVKEKKIKPFLLYLYSALYKKNRDWQYISINFCNIDVPPHSSFLHWHIHGITMFYNVYLNDESEFLTFVDMKFNEEKESFSRTIPLQPFKIMIFVNKPIEERSNEENEESEEEETEELSNPLPIEMHPPNHNFTGPGTLLTRSLNSKEEEQIKNAELTFKSDECVICLTNPPNVLFCNCGHIAICVECDKTKSLKTCPVCKTENTIKTTT